MKLTSRQLQYFIIVLLSLCIPFFVKSDYYMFLIILSGIYIISALGLNFILGMTGCLSFCQAIFMSLGAYVSAILTIKFGFSFWIAFIFSIFFVSFVSLLIGFPSLRLSGIYLVVVTIGFAEILRIIFLNWASVTGGAQGIQNIPSPHIFNLELNSIEGYYYLVLFMVILAIYISLKVEHSKLGRVFLAIKSSEIAAEAMGIDTHMHKVLVFIMSAAYAGAAGSLYAHFIGYIDSNSFTLSETVRLLCMVFVGGGGKTIGVVIGAILLVFLPEALRFLKDYYMAFYAIILLLVVIYMPEGILGLFKNILILFHSNLARPNNKIFKRM